MSLDAIRRLEGRRNSRLCSKCGEYRAKDQFHLRLTGEKAGKYRSQCITCERAGTNARQKANPEANRIAQRKYRAKVPGKSASDFANWKAKFPERAKASAKRSNLRQYGITPEGKAQRLIEQGGVCAICGTDTPSGVGWCVDHIHGTKTIRSILCAPCNIHFVNKHATPELLRHAADYLEKHGHYK